MKVTVKDGKVVEVIKNKKTYERLAKAFVKFVNTNLVRDKVNDRLNDNKYLTLVVGEREVSSMEIKFKVKFL